MILVIGGTGTVGTQVVQLLLAGKHTFKVLARDPAKVSKLGAQAVQGDLNKPETLAPAFQGIDRAFVVSSGPNIVQHDAASIAAAKKAGVKRVVLLSVMGAERDNAGIGAGWHRQGEEALKASGMQWTMLRPGGFMSNALFWAPMIKAQGSIFMPTGDGKAAPIDPADIAACAVKALTSDALVNQAFTLTGPELLSTAQQADVLATVSGRPVKHVDIPESVARENMLKTGMPSPLVDNLLQYYSATRAGHGAVTTDGVEKVLGRKPHTFGEWAKAHAAAFK